MTSPHRSTGLFGAALLALSLAMAGCGPATRDCPAPLGPIVVEDCDAYQRRAEALRVQVVGVFAGTAVEGSVARSRARSPGEAFEVLAERLHGLCRDHNACRAPEPAVHAAERDRLDAAFTAVAALVDQVHASEDHGERARLRGRLHAQLIRLAEGDAPHEIPRRHLSGRAPWMGTATPAIQPTPRGVPHLIGHRLDLEHVFDDGVTGYRPRVRADLWWTDGVFQPDDALVVTWPGGTAACPVPTRSRSGDGHASVSCPAPEAVVLTAASVAAKLSYRFGVDGREAPIGQISGRVRSADTDRPGGGPDRYGIDHDARIAHAHLTYRPVDGLVPATEGERPHLAVVLRQRKRSRPTLRCDVNGADAFGALRVNGRGSGQVGSFQDRPRWTRVAPGRSRAEAHPHLQWWRYDFALPFVRAGSPAQRERLRPWPLVGQWRCAVVIDGHPVRRVRFAVDAEGRPTVAEGVAPTGPAWPLPTEIVPSPFEEPVP